MREVRLQWLRPDEVVAERERVSIVYLPIGPIEWHGPHLPLGTDPLQAEHTALELAQTHRRRGASDGVHWHGA